MTSSSVSFSSHIVKRGKKYLLISKKTGKVLGTHSTRQDAEKQEQAIEISKHNAAVAAIVVDLAECARLLAEQERDDHGRFSGPGGGGGGGESQAPWRFGHGSQKADNASLDAANKTSAANERPSARSHIEAAKAREAAAELHSKAHQFAMTESGSSHHFQMAQSHRVQAAQHRVAATHIERYGL
jgi:hypothetical protein